MSTLPKTFGRRQRVSGSICTSRLGTRMSPLRRGLKTINRRRYVTMVKCVNGPWAGAALALTSCDDRRTLPIVIRGQAGHYHAGKWVPSC